ncbi:MAG: hypothetical protein AAFV80_02250 [Bacteroidota bacterium]
MKNDLMHTFFKVLLTTHIFFGSFSLILFWIPMLAKKGGKLHNKVGLWYVRCMAIVVATAGLMCMLDLVFLDKMFQGIGLGFLTLITMNPLWSGYDAVNHKKGLDEPTRKKRLFLESLTLIFGIFILYLAIINSNTLFYIFASLGIFAGQAGVRRYLKSDAPYNWLDTHLSGLIISGSAAYTAFFAFGFRRFIGDYNNQVLEVLPWVLPTVLGIIAIRFYRRKFNLRPKTATNPID